ncbi:uroporphyrinogen-III C-methyltransferase [Salinicola halophilus]|uniref:uroporphyrinogen-III C-methyltransferase n=1 Tax=Salinicola halophilus TaxID=184065 RepID=UPI000DA1BE9B|nr:uroporphyrinogen-III C-methyltransferase [Salinicola halophilus]
MSKQRKDSTSQSTPRGDKNDNVAETKADDAASPPDALASDETATPSADHASSATHASSARSAQPIKPDVTQPDSRGEPSSARSSGTGVGDASTAAVSPDASSASEAAAEPATRAKASGDKSSSGQTSTDKPAPDKATPGKASTAAASSSTTPDTDKRAQTSADRPTGPYARGGSGSGSGSGTPPSDNGTRGSGGGGKLGLIALVLLVLLALVVAVLGYQGWQTLQQQQARLDQMGSNRDAIGQIESRLDDIDQNRQQALNMMRGEFDQYRQSVDQTLDDVLDELAQQQQADPREWLHAEAEYLLRLANQRLQLERDVNGAKALLNTADDRLREADNPALVPIRRAIQSELAALDSVPNVDRTGLYLALMAQQEQLASLPLKQDIEQIAADGANTQPAGGWRDQLATLGSELKDLVTVRRHDQPLEALITPQQESYLRQNVRLLLEQAQLALLKAEPELYQASLDKAIELINGYYATDRDGVENALDKLQSLRDTEVRPELPDISESSQLLKRFIEQRFGNGGGNGGNSDNDSRGGNGASNGESQSGSAEGDDA